MMPVGMCVMRTAESVVFTCWPPAPLARMVSIRISSGAYFDIDVLGFGQDRNRRRRGVDAPLVLGFRHALDAMHAQFEFHARENALARDARHDFLVAARVGVAR